MNKKILLITGIIILVLIISSISYALWYFSFQQNETNTIKTNCFLFSFEEGLENIDLDNAYPMTDEEGKDTKKYTFQITNQCEDFVFYEIRLKEMEQSTLAGKYMKFALNSKIGSYRDQNKNENGTLLKEGFLGFYETKKFDFQTWMGDFVTSEDIDAMNKVFLSKITVTASPSNTLKKEINYHLNGGAFSSSYTPNNTHVFGEEYPLPTKQNVTKKEQVFDGWYQDAELTIPVTLISKLDQNDYELYAKYRNPTIHYEAGNASYVYDRVNHPEWIGESFTLSNDVRFSNFKFLGWYSDSNYTNLVTSVTADMVSSGDLTLYAKWNVVTDFWYFNTNTTDVVTDMPSNQLYIQGNTTTIPINIPKRNGYEFVGWLTRNSNSLSTWNRVAISGDVISAETTSVGERTLKALWKKSPDFVVNHIHYTILDNNQVSVLGADDGITEIEIPAQIIYQGITYTVQNVADYAFAFCNITSLKVNEGIKKLGIGSFYKTKNLSSVQLAQSINDIEVGSFNLSALKSVVLPKNLTELKHAVFKESSLENITLNEGLIQIGEANFYNTRVKELIMPDSLVKMLQQHVVFTKLHIGKSLGFSSFQSSENTTISISPENKNYKLINQIYLLSMDGKQLYGVFGTSNQIVVPNGVEILETYSLYVRTLNPIILPNTVKRISYRTLFNTEAPSINIPSSVMWIDPSAFNNTKVKEFQMYIPQNSISGYPWGSPGSNFVWN